MAVDLADRGAPARVRDEALARLGHVDILVNNAGGSRPTAVDARDGVWDESAAGPAKAAVHAWAKGLSRDVGRHGITVNCLAPARIHSEQIDQVGFLASPRARYITGERIHVDGGLRRSY
jgi:3-oxoacyl-[acyl-carrier protein] reductase